MRRDRFGFTLLETLVAISISMILGTVIYEFMWQSGRQYKQTLQKVESQKDLMMFVKYLQSDLAHLREYEPADDRFFRRERQNLYEVSENKLSFATVRGEKITYQFEPGRFSVQRTVENVPNEEISVKDQIWQKIQDRANKTFDMVTSEIKNQVNEKTNALKETMQLGNLDGVGNDPTALIQKCTDVFEKLQYYTGTDGSDSGFVTDLKGQIVGKAQQMASDIGYGIEADTEEIMGNLLTRYFQLEELAPPRKERPVTSVRTFPLKGLYQVLVQNVGEKAPGEVPADTWRNIRGFRFFLETSNPVSSLERLYQKKGLFFAPNALPFMSAKEKDASWNRNPPPRVKLKIMDLITKQELTGRYYGEAILPDANILYKTWVEVPEFWFLDIFNTEEEVEKLRKKLINPDDAEPKKK